MASAKKIRDEIMTMTIVVNSNPAQQEIYNLTKRNRELTAESKKLTEERKKVGAELGKNSQEYKDLTQKINDNTSAINSNNGRIKEMTESLDVTQMSVKQLKQELALLNRELERNVIGSDQYNALQQRIGQVSGRLAQVRADSKASGDGIEDLGSSFEEYGGVVAAVVGTIVGYSMTIQSVIDKNNEMADAMTAVEKATKMSSDEVRILSDEYEQLDTRTKKLDLLKIGEVGGRLGVPKAQILDFTKVVDKAYVALGDSWKGSVEDIADTMGKIANIYKETKDIPISDAINQIGSALNDLAADGTASEQNVADFVNRLGSMPPAMKPALTTLLGFGAAFEESGVDAEIASSGFAKFIRVASSNVAGFADIMRLPVSKVKEMINTDPAGFFLQFSEGLNGLDPTVLQNILGDLKLSDNEVQRVIGAAGENTDKFRNSVKTASAAVKEGTSLTNEANVANNNTAAIYEKIGKKFTENNYYKKLAEFLEGAVHTFGRFVGVVEDSDGVVTGFRTGLVFLAKVLAIVMATTISYNLVTGVYNALMKTALDRVLGLTVVEKARNAWTLIGTTINTLYNMSLALMGYAYAKVTRDAAQATFALQAFRAAAAANPLGLILTVITAVASAYLLFSEDTAKAVEAQKSLNQVMNEGAKNAASEVVDLDLLYKKAIKAKEGTDERRKAIEELKKQFPSYFGDLNTETAKNEDLRQSYLKLRDAIVASARAEAAKDELKKRQAERLKRDAQLQDDINEETKTRNDYKANSGGTKTQRMDGGDGKSFVSTINYDDLLEASRTRLAALKKLKETHLQSDKFADGFYGDAIMREEKLSEKYRNDKSQSSTVTSNYKDPGSDADKQAVKDSEKLRKEQEAEAKKQARLKKQHDDEMNDISKRKEAAGALETQIQLETEDSKIAIMQDGFEKELALIDLQEKRKAAEIDKKKIGKTEIDVLQKKIDKATGEDKELFQALMNSWTTNNADLEQLKLSNIAVFEAKRKALMAKTETENLKDQDETYQKELGHLTRQKNDELAQYETLAQLKEGLQGRISDKEMKQIKNWQDGKDALTKVYQQKEIDLHVAHLQSMIGLYEGLDMTILNKDQQEQVLKFIDEANNKISELKAKANETNQGKKSELKGKTALGNQGSTDILGMTIGDWETFFSNVDTGANKLGTISAAVGVLQSAFSTYYSFVQQKEQAQLKQVDTNAKKKESRLKKMLDNGEINQEQYDAAVQRLNQETEMAKYKLEYDAAKRNRNYMIAQTQANTAMAIMNIWATSNNPWVAAAMSIVVGALGIIQTANIAKQPLPEAPGFEDGYGMTYDMQREQDGKSYSVIRKPLRSGPVYRPTHFIAGEGNKMEMVIDNKTYRGFSPSFRKALNNEIAYSRGAQGYEGGYYPALQNKTENSDSMAMAEVVANNTTAMNELKNKNFRAYVVKDMDSAKTTIEMIDEYNSYKNQAKKP